jgi:hypothetical protein
MRAISKAAFDGQAIARWHARAWALACAAFNTAFVAPGAGTRAKSSIGAAPRRQRGNRLVRGLQAWTLRLYRRNPRRYGTISRL